MARVLIIGASRGIGLEVVERALAHGHMVRALARTAGGIETSHALLEKCAGDARNRSDVERALVGIDTVILALGVATGPAMVLGPVELFSDATRVLLSALKKSGVRRLISVTGFGAGDSHSKLGWLQGIAFQAILGRVYDDKTLQERLIQASDLDWVIVRPVVLTNGRRTGRYQILADRKDWRNGFISRADVADFVVKQIEDDTYLGKTPVLTY